MKPMDIALKSGPAGGFAYLIVMVPTHVFHLVDPMPDDLVLGGAMAALVSIITPLLHLIFGPKP